MKLGFKHRVRMLWWRIFSPWKYREAIKIHKAFEKIPQETKDELARIFWEAMIKKYNLKTDTNGRN